MLQAWSTLEIKSIDTEQRVLEGVASTPGLDRHGDSMDPAGAIYSVPLPLLWEHREAVGEVFDVKATSAGIFIKAKFSQLASDAPDALKARVETAWHSVSARPPLARGLSIGWAPVESQPIKGTKYTRHTKWHLGEISAVVIPANTEATITRIKEFDTAASGPITPRDGGTLSPLRGVRAARPMTTQEQITASERDIATKRAQMAKLMETAAADGGRTLDATEADQYDTLMTETKSLDVHVKRLKDMASLELSNATPITPTIDEKKAGELRGGYPVITVKPNVPKGTAFARMCMAIAAGKGDTFRTLNYAKQWESSTPEVVPMVEWMTKAAVAVGTTTDATWAGPLVVTQPLNEFLELLRPRTLIGRIAGLRQVPFNISMPSQTTGGTYGWVGQNKPKPVTKADYGTVTVGFAKAAGIIVISEELALLSTPSAEGLVREEMIAGMQQFLDTQFQDPAVAAVANVNPASITNGAPTAAASGATSAAAKTDLVGRIGVLTAAGIPLEGAFWIMNDSNAFGLSVSVNALGQPLFPGMSPTGGTLYGMPVYVSNTASTRVILAHAPSILYADEGGVRIDVSREAAVQMDSAPVDTVDATTVYLSLWQRNLVGLKAERFISWTRARANSVTYLTAAAYVGT